jgi:hypothetical protein
MSKSGGVFKVRIGALLLAAVLGAASSSVALADTIVGPTLSTTDFDYDFSGLGFTANVAAVLTGFTFENQDQADTIELVNAAGTVLDSVATPADTPSVVISGLNWSLSTGVQYYLLQSTSANSLYMNYNLTPPSDTQITLTNTGDFSFTSPASINFSIGGSGSGSSSGNDYWAAFNDITTETATPEPASVLLILPVALAMFLITRRKRAAPAN